MHGSLVLGTGCPLRSEHLLSCTTAKHLSLKTTALRGQNTGLQGGLQRDGATQTETLIMGKRKWGDRSGEWRGREELQAQRAN